LDLTKVVALKNAGDSIASYPTVGRSGQLSVELVQTADADILLEASPVNMDSGAEPGLTCVRTALQRGMHVAMPNKGPVVVAYDELHQLAAENGVQLRFDGTVAGGLPALYLGQRDLRGADVSKIEAVPNLTTGYVMDLVAAGKSWDAAIEKARQDGSLEGDGTWDLDGWDAASKLVILANAVMGYPAKMQDVILSGVTGLDSELLRAARQRGEQYRLLVTVERVEDGGCQLKVEPMALPADHLLGRLGQKQMGVVYYTDIYGTIAAIIDEQNPIPSAATMLRDLLDIYL
jgi:homoserine dehydrogenase